MNELETKRQRIEKWTKIAAFFGLCIALGPIYIILLQGIAALFALVISAVVAFTAINLIPALSRHVANWRLKALKAVAAANPIETLENRYQELQTALNGTRDNIKKSYAVLQTLDSQIETHKTSFPDRPSQHLEKRDKLKALVQLRGDKYKEAKENLNKFANVIEEKRSDWEIAKTMAEASKLANAGEEFQSKLMQDTALNTIQDGLNLAFAELETSLLDEQHAKTTVITATVVKALPEKSSSSIRLDLDSDLLEAVPVSANAKFSNI